jgi:AraC-like DNA-binding protein
MQPNPADKAIQPILYSCYFAKSREGEQFIPEHIISYQISGSFYMNDGQQAYTFEAGESRFCQRNRLAKFSKQPPENGEFRSISIYFDQDLLRSISLEYGFQAQKQPDTPAFVALRHDPLLQSYFDSLVPYEHEGQYLPENLKELKLREGVLVLLQTHPELKDVLFDFTEPGKIDLEGFMQQNFHFNVELKRFAFLTGRSLATFKRDFEKIFHLSPSRWLLQRRLQEAHYRIKECREAPSDVYLELGFEDLSHFSFAFKKKFGVAPSQI